MNFDSSTLRNLSFGKAARGYSIEEVHHFLNEVADHVESLERQLAEQQPKMVALAEKVAEYRGYEDGLKNTLIEAQKLAAHTVSDARAKADALVADAKKESEQVLGDARKQAQAQTADITAQINAKKAELTALQEKIASCKAESIAILEKQMALLNGLPVPEEEPEPAPEQETIYSSSSADDEAIHPHFTVE